MHDATRVGVREGIRDLLKQVCDCIEAWPSIARHKSGEALPANERHRETDDARFLVDRVNRYDVRMIESRCRLRLAYESLAHVGSEGEIGGQHLERDATLEPHIFGRVDDGHSAPTDFFADEILIAKRRGDAIEQQTRICRIFSASLG